ncbi:MAG: glycosyltransferase family 2 protein [Acidobacteriota bacterium]|nr:glycosyltransferase family 2 protein [Acidobacteriota bacterium]
MRVSVIVLNWNGREVLPDCLDSLGQCDPPPHEIIVVDNGSTDGSADWLRQDSRPNVRKIFLADNLGYAAGNNVGIRAAEGEVIALLNNDTRVDTDWIGAAMEASDDENVDMIACKTLRMQQPETMDKAGHLMFPDGMNRGRGTGQPAGLFDEADEILWPDGSGAFYRKSMLDRIGLLDEDFYLYGEDAELGMRARWAGYRCVYAPRSVIYHHHSAGLGRFAPQKIYYIERNRLWLMLKTFPLSLILVSPFTTTWRYLMNGLSLLTGRGSAAEAGKSASPLAIIGAILKAWLHGLIGAPKMLAKRRDYPKTITGNQMRRLLARFRISARELTLND